MKNLLLKSVKAFLLVAFCAIVGGCNSHIAWVDADCTIVPLDYIHSVRDSIDSLDFNLYKRRCKIEMLYFYYDGRFYVHPNGVWERCVYPHRENPHGLLIPLDILDSVCEDFYGCEDYGNDWSLYDDGELF